MDVGVGDADELPRRLRCFQDRYQCDVVLEQSAERRLLLGGVLQGLHEGESRLVELNLVLLHEGELVPPEERGAAVDGVGVVGEDLRGLLLEDGGVTCTLQLGREEMLVVVALHLLQAHDVRLVAQQLPQEVLLAVGPGEGPRRAVVEQLRARIEVRQQVVRQHGEPPARVGELHVWEAYGDHPARRGVGRGPDARGGDAPERGGFGAPGVRVHDGALVAEDEPDVVRAWGVAA
mmetsp:Transcript_23949/g.57082  ORF Transcript_23949/g.57082 Transcript_23949/m.57082 type:complete len:234 (+) Transcript_23949:890-1591(+)